MINIIFFFLLKTFWCILLLLGTLGNAIQLKVLTCITKAVVVFMHLILCVKYNIKMVIIYFTCTVGLPVYGVFLNCVITHKVIIFENDSAADTDE